MLEKVRVGIIGTGNLVSIADAHLKGYMSHPDVTVTALYDAVYENAVSWSKNKNLSEALICRTLDELFEAVDAVSICTPNFTHVELVKKALKAGKHVLCEKPLSVSYKDGLPLAEYAAKIGQTAMVDFNYRNIPAIRYLKKLIEDGKLGDIYVYRHAMGGNRLANPGIKLEWRMKRSLSGSGALTDFGSHMIDMAEYLLGDREGKIQSLHAYTKTFIHTRPSGQNNAPGIVENDDCAVFSAAMEKGALLSFVASRVGMFEHRIEIVGAGGYVCFDEKRPTELTADLKEPHEGYKGGIQPLTVPEEFITNIWRQNDTDLVTGTIVDVIHKFVEAAKDERKQQPDLQRGLYVQRMIDLIEQSSREGVTITIPY